MPSNARPNAALVIYLHGASGQVRMQAHDTRLSQYAETYGQGGEFLVAYGEGFPTCELLRFEDDSEFQDRPCVPRNPFRWKKTWEAGSCCSPVTNFGHGGADTPDDAEYIKGVIADIVSRGYSIDTRRVYVTGLSNGGQLTYKAACVLSDWVAAVAPVAGAITNWNTTGCYRDCDASKIHLQDGCYNDEDSSCRKLHRLPELDNGRSYGCNDRDARPMPMMIIHGGRDEVISPYGGAPAGLFYAWSREEGGMANPPVKDVADHFRWKYGCPTSADKHATVRTQQWGPVPFNLTALKHQEDYMRYYEKTHLDEEDVGGGVSEVVDRTTCTWVEGCDDARNVTVCWADIQAHGWPGGYADYDFPECYEGTPLYDQFMCPLVSLFHGFSAQSFHATYHMIEFFFRHQLDQAPTVSPPPPPIASPPPPPDAWWDATPPSSAGAPSGADAPPAVPSPAPDSSPPAVVRVVVTFEFDRDHVINIQDQLVAGLKDILAVAAGIFPRDVQVELSGDDHTVATCSVRLEHRGVASSLAEQAADLAFYSTKPITNLAGPLSATAVVIDPTASSPPPPPPPPLTIPPPPPSAVPSDEDGEDGGASSPGAPGEEASLPPPPAPSAAGAVGGLPWVRYFIFAAVVVTVVVGGLTVVRSCRRGTGFGRGAHMPHGAAANPSFDGDGIEMGDVGSMPVDDGLGLDTATDVAVGVVGGLRKQTTGYARFE